MSKEAMEEVRTVKEIEANLAQLRKRIDSMEEKQKELDDFRLEYKYRDRKT